MMSANTTTSTSGSPYFKYQTPMSNLRPSTPAVKPATPLPPALLLPPTSSAQLASLNNGGSIKPVMMRAKFGRLPVISVNGSGHNDDDREILFADDGHQRNEDGIDSEDDEDVNEEEDSDDDAKLLETLSKVMTTKSLRLQRVTRLIESSQEAATAKIKARKEVTDVIVVLIRGSIECDVSLVVSGRRGMLRVYMIEHITPSVVRDYLQR